jgi:mono/diheme cytochrome c family protein/glucose/arabinose dehydrogenase
VQRVPADSPPRSPADEMKTFFMPPGFHVELVASEPLIQDPILIDWDPDGRLWAIEMPGYMHDIRASDELQPTGRVVVLEDTNADGVMDKRTVFADGLVLPRALKVLDHGVLVGEPPNLWLMRDTNGDLKSDIKESVTDSYGRREATVEHNANSLLWALDNWMYTSEVDVYFRLRRGQIETRKTLSRGQWGATQDDAGRVYRNTNQSVLHVDVVPTPYYARNTNLLRTRGSYESLEGDDHEVNVVWPVRPTRGVNRGYQAGVLRPDGTLAEYTSVSSPLVYRGDRLPKDLYGNVFVTEPAGNLVSRIIVEDGGQSLQASKAYDGAEFLAATDERFRPVYLSNAPDGTLYIVDMYRGIIQHREYVTEYLRDQILSRKLEQPTAMGRIYRVVHDTTRRDTPTGLAHATPAELVTALSHPNGWWRDTAQRLLVERGDTSVVPALKALATDAADPRARLHALWTLDGLDSLTPDLVTRALDDRSRDVRTSAVRLAERFVETQPDPAVQRALVRRIDDQDWAVREQLAASLGALPLAARVPAVAVLLARHGDDPITVDAAISGVSGHETEVIDQLITATAPTPMLESAITMLSATVVHGGQAAPVTSVFTWAGDQARPEWQRSALLRGAEVALLGATMPGTPARAQASAAAPAAEPCATCPGGRGGPGGAPAFPKAPAGRAATAAPGRGGRSAGPMLRLDAELTPLVAMASARDALGSRAARILEHVQWPGKAGASAAAAPLTPEEQQWFNSGEQVYKNLCQACHQADGHGQERMGANLVGSSLALGSPQVAARVVLNGKEGKIGLMPPLGGALSDDQIAGALTFVRRQWGNDASPVPPSFVKSVRAQTADRTRPWTDDELAAIK